jgi:hypothetical protein
VTALLVAAAIALSPPQADHGHHNHAQVQQTARQCYWGGKTAVCYNTR